MIKYLGNNTKNIGIKKIMKKNQVVILALALMLMTAGYLNYTNNHENENLLLAGLGDAQLVSANAIDQSAENSNIIATAENDNNAENEQVASSENQQVTNQENTNEQAQEASENEPTGETSGDVQTQETSTNEQTGEVSTKALDDDYFTRSRLERETMYSQMLETYTGILENEKISSEQKDIAENEIKNINDTKNAIMVVENLLETKGFENAIVFVNTPSVNVVIKAKELGTEQVAQVQNIVQRELKTEIENIHITTN